MTTSYGMKLLSDDQVENHTGFKREKHAFSVKFISTDMKYPTIV